MRGVANEALSRETIGYYQTASYLYRNGGYLALSPDEQARFVAQHAASQTSALQTSAAVAGMH